MLYQDGFKDSIISKINSLSEEELELSYKDNIIEILDV